MGGLWLRADLFCASFCAGLLARPRPRGAGAPLDRRWTVLATCAGIIWGVAGAAFLVPVSGILQVVTVAVIVAVTFASWPVYSCWMPSLTFFTLLSLAPMTISVAVQYGVSQTIMALVLLVVTVFILYSGRRLNEMILSSILMDDENRRLVERLKREVSRTEAARRATQAESERRARFLRRPTTICASRFRRWGSISTFSSGVRRRRRRP